VNPSKLTKLNEFNLWSGIRDRNVSYLEFICTGLEYLTALISATDDVKCRKAVERLAADISHR